MFFDNIDPTVNSLTQSIGQESQEYNFIVVYFYGHYKQVWSFL